MHEENKISSLNDDQDECFKRYRMKESFTFGMCEL